MDKKVTNNLEPQYDLEIGVAAVDYADLSHDVKILLNALPQTNNIPDNTTAPSEKNGNLKNETFPDGSAIIDGRITEMK